MQFYLQNEFAQQKRQTITRRKKIGKNNKTNDDNDDANK